MAESPFAITGAIPDELYNAGRPPTADGQVEYLAGGGPGFPLAGQVELSRACDDLTRDLGHDIYEVMMNDPTVSSGFWVVATAIMNGRFQVVPSHEVRPGEEDSLTPEQQADVDLSREIAAFITRQVKRQTTPIEETALEFLHGMIYGTKLGEKVFEPGIEVDAGRACLKHLRTKPNRSWNFVVTPHGDVVAVRGAIVGGQTVDLPPEKFMVFRWLPQDGDPRGRSLLRPAYNGWNLKINSWPKLYKYLDRFGTPITVGTCAPDAPDEPLTDDRGRETGEVGSPTRAFGAQLARLEGGSWIAIRAGAKVEVFSPTGNGEVFLNAIDIFKHEILEGILMTSRATLEAEHGSKADTQQAHHVVARLIGLGRKTAEAMFKGQLFRHLVELNWGAHVAERFTPDCSLGEVEAKDVAQVLGAFTQAGYLLDLGHFPQIDAMAGLRPREHGPSGLAVPPAPPPPDARPSQEKKP